MPHQKPHSLDFYLLHYKNTFTQSFANDATILAEASQSMIKVNSVLGKSRRNESALGADARAASLITQNDLKSLNHCSLTQKLLRLRSLQIERIQE